MPFFQRFARWLESHWVTPAYSGWVLLGTALFFFGAASNTMAGWLYVMSGVIMALLSIASILPQQALKGITISRPTIAPVTAGQALMVEVVVENSTPRPKSLLQVRDHIPRALGNLREVAIATIAPKNRYHWVYEIPTPSRGIYHWQTLQLRTGAPLGLFWCSREQGVNTKAIVYPQILPLTHCPIVDALGEATGSHWQVDHTAQSGNEGLTRALRPYRWGDPTRLIHWRTSARYSELRVRELERFTSSQTVVISLDTDSPWNADTFEQAVIVTASLYRYAQRQGLTTQFWSPQTSLILDNLAVLTTLASIRAETTQIVHAFPSAPLIWISPSPHDPLPPGSRQVILPVKSAAHSYASPTLSTPGLVIDPHKDLQQQLQHELIVTTH
jgi:uncharacterized protein (DUF58 family)